MHVTTSVNQSEGPLGIPSGSAKLAHTEDRTDQEIIASILEPKPVTSEKNVWAFWNTGFESMRSWSQRNVIGWVRLLGPEWTVRILDCCPGSPTNIFNYLDATQPPKCLAESKMEGKYSGQHASDIVRLPLIYEHGGVWLDVGIMLFMHLDDMCWKQLESPRSRYEVALASADPSLVAGLAENFFLAARKGNRFVHRWMRIFFEVWKDRATCDGIHAHPLFQHLVSDSNIARFLQGQDGAKLDYFGAYLAY
ncbi:hypothetical protein H2198_005623 [Neophaeococcomyces mojaviensis]|uniref:Uncharacterized protein n=1 Tax=Neophaeococcomyces mojaviensis TaxID=3383035 RepID=A0ACC3A584_9EURO|nr:hypothetical protein H2198_005623 [Knufia sp. JES_112]